MSSRFLVCLDPTTASPAVATVSGADAAAETTPRPAASSSLTTTSLYHTDHGVFALTWSRRRLSRSLRLHFSLSRAGADPSDAGSLSSAPFRLHIKPLLFWTKRGSQKLPGPHSPAKNVAVFWDLTRASYGSGRPDPKSGFFVAVVVDGAVALLVGDSSPRAAEVPNRGPRSGSQTLVLKKENFFGAKVYNTSARIGGKNREIWVDCRSGGKSGNLGLSFGVDSKTVLEIQPLRWKFRGNERVEVDGVQIQVSWDVYNWVFEDAVEDHAVFMFRLEKQEACGEKPGVEEEGEIREKVGAFQWSQRFGGDGLELSKKMKKMMKKKGLLKSGRSWSSSSLSSASSSGGSSSVMEWASVEESELMGPTPGFSLLVRAWRSR